MISFWIYSTRTEITCPIPAQDREYRSPFLSKAAGQPSCLTSFTFSVVKKHNSPAHRERMRYSPSPAGMHSAQAAEIYLSVIPTRAIPGLFGIRWNSSASLGFKEKAKEESLPCLLYTSDAADDV